MFPSNTYHNVYDQVSNSDQASFSKPFPFDTNLTSKQESLPPPPPPLSFFHFPSYEENEIFLQPNHDLLFHHHQSLPEPAFNMEVSTKTQIPRKRSCKRDRHSKINTARGLRDRRMRLSLEVARRFFGLQDMLGFDKASKTVEWLLNQSKDEIKQLAIEKNIHPVKSASSTSECEGLSGLDEVALSGNIREQQGQGQPLVKRRMKTKPTRKSAFHPLAREAREKAREKARERTKEKNKSRKLADESKKCNETITNHNLSQFGSWNPFETGEESGTQSQKVNPSLDVVAEAEERSSHAKWSPSMNFSSLNNSGFLQEHQFSEFQSLAKLWEAYNNHI